MEVEFGDLLIAQNLNVNLDVTCGSIIIGISGRDPDVDLAVAYLLTYCHTLPTFGTLCGPDVSAPSHMPSIAMTEPSVQPAILTNSEAIIDPTSDSSHPPFHESVGFYVVITLIFLLLLLWMYCHYGPKVKLYCFCDKDERKMIEFANYPKKNMDIPFEGHAQTIPSIERKKRNNTEEGEMGDELFQPQLVSRQIEGLSEAEEPGITPGNPLDDIAFFAMSTKEGSNKSIMSEYPHDGDEFDDLELDMQSESDSELYGGVGGADSPGGPRTVDDKRCPSAKKSWDEVEEKEEKRFHNDQPNGGFWKPRSFSEYVPDPDEDMSEDIWGLPPRSRPRPYSSSVSPVNRAKRSVSLAYANANLPKREEMVRYSEITPRAAKKETPRGGGKETKRFPRRRVLSRHRYFDFQHRNRERFEKLKRRDV